VVQIDKLQASSQIQNKVLIVFKLNFLLKIKLFAYETFCVLPKIKLFAYKAYFLINNMIILWLFYLYRLLANGFQFKEKEQDILMRRILTEQIKL
jgi:hypothetical protein